MIPRKFDLDAHTKQIYAGNGGRPPTVEYQRFSSDYFTGADTRIYFGDQWIDEVTHLSFEVVENVQPIYGYASYTYDAVARGARQIQGQFAINFKESYYLHSITNGLELRKREQQQAGYQSTYKDYNTVKKGITADNLLSKAAGSGADFEKAATMYEKALWGGEENQNMRMLVNRRGHNSYFVPENVRPLVHKEGFSILIMYGPEPGMKEMYRQGTEDISRTAHSLVGVQLTGLSHQVDSSGQPLQEIYSFIARDVDWNINLEKN